MSDDLYRVAREVTDEVFGEGTYAEINKGNPDPRVREQAQLSAGRLIDLARDWQRYGELSPMWRDQMRRALVVEMRLEVDRLARACGFSEPNSPTPRRRWFSRRRGK